MCKENEKICLGNGQRIYNTRSYVCHKVDKPQITKLSDLQKSERLDIALKALKQDFDFEFWLIPLSRVSDFEDTYEVFLAFKELTALGLAKLVEEPKVLYDDNGEINQNSPHGYYRFTITNEGLRTESIKKYKNRQAIISLWSTYGVAIVAIISLIISFVALID